MRGALLLALGLSLSQAMAEPQPSPPPEDDGWFDVSSFLNEKYGFLPIVVPITEPAVGYGAAGGLMFLDQPMARTANGFDRPNISIVGGFGTENNSWGTAVGDFRTWQGGRLQTLAGLLYASVNLDFYGVGEDTALEDTPLRYALEPFGGAVQGKYRLSNPRLWVGLSYALVETRVLFEAPEGTPGLPDFDRDSDVGGLTPSFTFDTRDNIFTPTRGTFVEASLGYFDDWLGSDDEFERARILAMHFWPLPHRLYLGARLDTAAAFGDAPFYLEPFVSLRGAPVLRYQGETIAQLEAELRWQFYKRLSVVGFAGAGQAWNGFAHQDDSQSVGTGGAGFRYELAREYGIHAGVDVAFGPDGTAYYLQIGSAWARP
jgi:hypothetical protein